MEAVPSTSDYTIPKPSRIKLKETKTDKATRLYRREQRRLRLESQRISRANGYAVSPPRRPRTESISPPRHPSRSQPDDPEGEVGGYRWMGSLADTALEDLARKEREERLAWLEQQELSRATGDPFPRYHHTAQPIPRRFREAAGLTYRKERRRDPSREVELGGGTVPDMGAMGEEEYAEWVRTGMYRLKHRAEVQETERLARIKQEAEAAKVKVRERARKEEKRRIERLKAQKGEKEEGRRKKEREKYRSRWKSLAEVGGDIELTELGYHDIPWPTYSGVELDEAGIKNFLSALATDEADGGYKKVLREAIRLFHPDRFFGRVLGRVKERDREKVKEGVERCSRVINDLAAEVRDSGM